MKINRWVLSIGAVAALAVGLLGCGGGTETETTAQPIKPLRPAREVGITIDGYPSPENVGIEMALKRGYFEDLGIDLFLHEPESPQRPVLYVATREVDLAVSHEPQVAVAQENGVPVVAVASLVPRPTAAMIWLRKSKIGGIADLKGKTIAIAGLPFERDLLQSILVRAGLTLDDVKVESVGYELVPALASGRADAIFGGSWNVEGIELEKRGLKPVVKRVQDLGVPPYDELVLIARRDRLERDPQSIRNFIAAMNRGTAAAIEDPKAAANLIASRVSDPNRAAIKAEVKATLPMLSKSGRMDPEQAGNLLNWMHEEGLTKRPLSASDLITNSYLPPQS